MKSHTTALTAQGLTKKFGDFTAVNEIDFTVNHGEIFGFLGPNGSGKTTTIRMLLGLIQPTSGKINLLGLDTSQHAAQLRPRVGYMSQRFSLYNDLTVVQNLKFYGGAYGLENTLLKERMQHAIEMAGILGNENTPTKELSGGWRQRLALSAAILHRPEVLFLDEPTAGVDPISRRAFWDLLYQLVDEGITVFITTHYMDEAEHCHRLAFIQRGRIIAQGSPERIKQEMMPGKVLEIEPSNAAQAVIVLRRAQQAGKINLEMVDLYGSLVHVVGIEMEKLKPEIEDELLNAGIKISHMEIIEPTLEDVFISCMR